MAAGGGRGKAGIWEAAGSWCVHQEERRVLQRAVTMSPPASKKRAASVLLQRQSFSLLRFWKIHSKVVAEEEGSRRSFFSVGALDAGSAAFSLAAAT
jgi:hypothetical protein